MRFKYRNRPTIINGKWFASKKEAKRYQELCLLQKAGEISHLKIQVPFPIVICGEKICKYIADFTYQLPSGKLVVEDAKGFKTPIYKLKKKLMWIFLKIDIKEV